MKEVNAYLQLSSLSSDKNTLVLEDKNGFIKKKYGLSLFLLLPNNIPPIESSNLTTINFFNSLKCQSFGMMNKEKTSNLG